MRNGTRSQECCSGGSLAMLLHLSHQHWVQGGTFSISGWSSGQPSTWIYPFHNIPPCSTNPSSLSGKTSHLKHPPPVPTGMELGVLGPPWLGPTTEEGNCSGGSWYCPHSELVIMEGLQVEGGRTLWSKLKHQVRKKEKI